MTGASLIEDRRGRGPTRGIARGLIPRQRPRALRPIPRGSDAGALRAGSAHADGDRYRNGVYHEQARHLPRDKTDPRVPVRKADRVRALDSDGSTTFSVSSRQKPTTIHYGPGLSAGFDFRLDLALAHYRNTVADLVAGVRGDLAKIDAQRPAGPAGLPV